MKPRERVILALAVTVLLAFAGWMLMQRVGVVPADRRFAADFATLRRGMSEGDVIALLGRPDDRTTDFRLGQYAGNESKYHAAKASGSTYYLLWRREGHIIYAAGFDAEQRMTYATFGGT